MSFNTELFAALKTLVSNRVHPKPGPAGVLRPYITYQRVGGRSINFVEPALPGKRNARYQVNVWADTAEQADALALQVESILRLSPTLQTTVLGEPTDTFEEDTKLHGTRQDFSFWMNT
jgi:hypothetical protein